MKLTDKYNNTTDVDIKQGCLIIGQSTDMVVLDKSEAIALAEFILKTYKNN